MPVDNPAFADEGEAPGIPRAWTLRSFVRAERKAGFGTSPGMGVESFEGWSSLLERLGVVEQVFFDGRPEGFEDFTEGWNVDTYVVDFSDVAAALAQLGSGDEDRFVIGWGVEAFGWSLERIPVEAASFVGESDERFERGHRNDSFRWAFHAADLTRATFGGAPAETFETTWPAREQRGGRNGE